MVLQDIGGLITDLNIHSTATDNSCVIYANVLCFNLVFVFFVTIFHPAQRDSSGKTSKKGLLYRSEKTTVLFLHSRP